ncbi:hypothetical protein HNR23_004890 [Nocardiopsis mwathae]|uniref:Uncharacterized protein n=1 Tax=Nocardiopsis mwathae TaxID=1472723 RepID=A0A7X0D7Y8_9ACTN|nr:hypothetical protein [Nocardiopsis mwathae]MBB6174830.1 hypothetical protein [Nocardiopsis mwathae]
MTTSLTRYGRLAVVLLCAVVFHMLCSAGHPAAAVEMASADAPPSATGSASVSGVGASPSEGSNGALAAPSTFVANMGPALDAMTFGAHQAGEAHECVGATDGNADQRGSTPNPLSLLLAVGLAVLVVVWAPSAPVRPFLARGERRTRRRRAAHLLLALCTWRV